MNPLKLDPDKLTAKYSIEILSSNIFFPEHDDSIFIIAITTSILILSISITSHDLK